MGLYSSHIVKLLMVRHTTFIIYDENRWTKLKLLASAQKMKIAKVLDNAVEVYLNQYCQMKSMDDYMSGELKPMVKINPMIDTTKNQVKLKLKSLSLDDIGIQQKWALMYMDCLNHESVNRYAKPNQNT